MHVVPASVLLDMSRDHSGHRERRDNSWYGYSEGNTWGAFPFAVSYLYRGQTAHHFPLLPSIVRGLDTSDIAQLWRGTVRDQAKIVLRLAQSWWFAKELTHHPISAHAKDQQLPLNALGLAQHYGIPTGYLDLTDDFNVSAFFATCRPTAHGWEPMDSGTGVIYRVGLRTLDNPFDYYAPLGPQRLPRPTEQCAWVAELPLCHSFDGWPGVSKLQFHHDRRIAEHFMAMFEGGEQLFPADPLADVADEILACRELPVDIADAALESFASDAHGVRMDQVESVRRAIAELVTLTGYRRLLNAEQISPLLEDPQWRSRMLADVTVNWRAVRLVPIAKDEGEPVGIESHASIGGRHPAG